MLWKNFFLQAYRTASGDDRGMEIPNQISSQTSTCVVSLSPASTRRGERRSNHEPVTFSPSPEKVKCHQHRERTSSSSPSLRINVRISTSTGRGTGRTAAEMANPVGFNSNEKHLSGGSSFYPVTTISRKIRPEDSFSPQEHYFLETDFSSPSERHGPLRANELRQVSTNSYSSQGESGALSGAGGEPRQSAIAYSQTPRHSEVDGGGHRRFPKMTSYQEITLAKLGSAGANALAPHSSSMTAQPRASSQEAFCSSSHFIQMGTTMPPPGTLVPDSSQSPQQSGVSSLIGPRHQMFVSARPQSYESLFGRNQLGQSLDANPALTGGASRSSSELVESSSFARAMQSSAAVGPNPSTTAEQPRINLVAERMKRFETVDANSTEGVRHLRALKPWVDEPVAKGSCPQFGFDSVAKRAAHFEQISSEDACRRATEPAVTQGKRSEPSKTYRAGGTGEPRELWSSSPSPSSASSKQVPQSVTIPLYFRADPLSSSLRLTSPALRRHDAVPQNHASDGAAVAEALVSYDASSLEKKAATHSSDLLPSPKLPARQLSSSYQEKSGMLYDYLC